MSAIASNDLVIDGPVVHVSLVRPVWLRSFTVLLALTTHILVVACFIRLTDEKITPLGEIRVDLVPQGETVTETSTVATPESAPVVTQEQAVLASPDPEMRDDPDVSKPVEQMAVAEPVPDLVAPPPKIESLDAPPIAVERPQPQKIENTKTLVQTTSERPQKSKLQEAKRRAAMRALKRAKAEAHARQISALAQLGAPAIRAGVREGTGEAQRMSQAAYGALVSAEINRHKYYPAGAREDGATGNVGVAFSIGASGAIVSHTITHSSGNAAIDSAVHQIMASSHPPPPPTGSFRSSVTMHFSVVR